MAFYRRDDWVNNGFGQPVPNVAVTYYVQPTMALATVYADSIGTPATNPQLTDGIGHAIAYLAPASYTLTYSGLQIQTLTIPDQTVQVPVGIPQTVTPTGTPDGTLRTFTIPSAVINPAASLLFINGGLVNNGTDYIVAGTTITWLAVTPPQVGDSLSYVSWVTGFSGGGVNVVINFADDETPSGAINGSNASFTLAHSPSPAGSLLLMLQGQTQNQGVGKDFTLSGNIITFASAPNIGPLLAWYRY